MVDEFNLTVTECNTTLIPTEPPTGAPSNAPSAFPSPNPTTAPTSAPTNAPSSTPTKSPVITDSPTTPPTTSEPTGAPTQEPCDFLVVIAYNDTVANVTGTYMKSGNTWVNSDLGYQISRNTVDGIYWQISNTKTNSISDSLVERSGEIDFKPPKMGKYSFYQIRKEPTSEPTTQPSNTPTGTPTSDPSSSPTTSPSGSPTLMTNDPSTTPSMAPSITPTITTNDPSISPTMEPTTTRRRLQPGGFEFFGELYDIKMECSGTDSPTTATPSVSPTLRPTSECYAITIDTNDNNFAYPGLYDRSLSYDINNSPFW
eukprot:CAMPEP_0114671192 /NCGR_PEP_ID=MMETSP0191-20121206/40735_1 /TAXON_ID=126664 /ORGANISM="Sorites sp." /LENGTH=313 /DNA_ID=CAMNT_0001930435 /DNA_START=1535 /DNA_END=2473 /DNA_ORIENTATION=-